MITVRLPICDMYISGIIEFFSKANSLNKDCGKLTSEFEAIHVIEFADKFDLSSLVLDPDNVAPRHSGGWRGDVDSRIICLVDKEELMQTLRSVNVNEFSKSLTSFDKKLKWSNVSKYDEYMIDLLLSFYVNSHDATQSVRVY